MKKLRKGIILLIILLMFVASNNVYATNYSIRVMDNGLLRSDGNYYATEYNYAYNSYTGARKAIKNVIYANQTFYITNDGKLCFHGGQEVLDNVSMVSDVDNLNSDFYYLDTKGNLMHSSNPFRKDQFGLNTYMVVENIGSLKQLSYGYALTKNGDLYNLNSFEAKLIDTNVKSYQHYTAVIYSNNIFGGKMNTDQILYLKNNNSLYTSFGANMNNEKSRHLLDNVSYYEVMDSQIRAKTTGNSWYKWGDNESYQVYKNIVDGYNVAPKYVDTPQKITDNIMYQTDDYELRLDGKLYKKTIQSGNVKYTLLDKDVASVIDFGLFYLYQKFNDDVYSIRVERHSSVAPTPRLLCKDAVKGLDKDNHFIVKKDGTLIVFNDVGDRFDIINPSSKYFSSSNWAQAELQEADKLGLLDPVIDYVFDIDITRKEFCILIVAMCEAYSGKQMPISSTNPFNDLGYDLDKSERDIILKAYAAGIVSGIDATRFSPDSNVDRQQMAAMMYRAAKYLNPKMTYGEPAKFSDAGKFGGWAVEGINAMSSLGIIVGSNGQFNPNDKATIEQAGMMILRLFKKMSL